jgi:hypothetical protein
VFLLLLLNVVMFVLDHVLHVPGIQGLYLNHLKPQWYQVRVTHSSDLVQCTDSSAGTYKTLLLHKSCSNAPCTL